MMGRALPTSGTNTSRQEGSSYGVLFAKTTRDDRVRPAHARKMAARMEAMGLPFYYFENTEGGPGAGPSPGVG